MTSPNAFDEETDVLVIGAGAAGLSAAIEACEAGRRALVLEATSSVLNSSSALSSGLLSFAGTDVQKERGIEDSIELLRKDLVTSGMGRNDPNLIEVYVNHQLSTYHWLRELGTWFIGVETGAAMSVPRCHVVEAEKWVSLLQSTAEKEGATILFETRGLRLMLGSRREVVGVRAQKEGSTLRVKARRAVVLATGGFGRNSEMLEESVEGLSKAAQICGIGHMGDGLRMARELGAGTRNMSLVRPSFSLHPICKESKLKPFDMPRSLLYYRGGIIVNKDGRRFVDESSSYQNIGTVSLRQKDATGFTIFDSKIAEACQDEKLSIFSFPHIRGFCSAAETVEDIASKIGVDGRVLAETVARYNLDVEAGVDREFGRRTLVGGVGRPVKIDTPPFYAFETVAGMLATVDAGVTVDERARVKNVFGEVIPRLYAVGEIIGGVSGAGYMTGTSLCKAVIFGRIAGVNAAAEEPLDGG